MVRQITDLLTTIFLIALAAFLVRNAEGTAKIAKTGTSFVGDTIRAFTFQSK
jgi:hypothetical protein